METLVATQGVSSSLALGPTIAGATPGSHEFASQASTEGTGGKGDPQEKVGTEDAHDEEETDMEKWERLMYHADGVWRCAGWGGRAFSPVYAAAALQVRRAWEETGQAKVPGLFQRVSVPGSSHATHGSETQGSGEA
jgi:hypothetical protein